MVEGTEGSHHKEGSTKMSQASMVCAGIDTGKHKLDVAIDGSAERLQVDNSAERRPALLAWLQRRGVSGSVSRRAGATSRRWSPPCGRPALLSLSFSPRRCVPTPSSCATRQERRMTRH